MLIKNKPMMKPIALAVILLFAMISHAQAGVKSYIDALKNVHIEISENNGISSYYIFQSGKLNGKGKTEAQGSFKECPNKIDINLGVNHLHAHTVIYGTCAKRIAVKKYEVHTGFNQVPINGKPKGILNFDESDESLETETNQESNIDDFNDDAGAEVFFGESNKTDIVIDYSVDESDF